MQETAPQGDMRLAPPDPRSLRRFRSRVPLLPWGKGAALLSDEALALFQRLPVIEGDAPLFPAPEGGMLSDSTLGALIDDMHAADIKRGGLGYLDPNENRIARQHGFRSTFKDWAAEIGLFERDIVEHALAHKIKDKAEAAYQRGTMLLTRAYVMKQWGEFCDTPVFRAPTMYGQLDQIA